MSYDNSKTTEPRHEPEDNRSGHWCDDCLAYDEHNVAVDTIEDGNGDSERLCQRCIQRRQDLWLDRTPR